MVRSSRGGWQLPGLHSWRKQEKCVIVFHYDTFVKKCCVGFRVKRLAEVAEQIEKRAVQLGHELNQTCFSAAIEHPGRECGSAIRFISPFFKKGKKFRLLSVIENLVTLGMIVCTNFLE